MTRPSSPMAAPAAEAWRRNIASAQRQSAAWWAARTRRERGLLRAGALLLSLTLLWTLGLKPALDSLSRSREQLPRLHAEAARIDALILEAQALQRRQSGRMDAATLPDALRATLRRAGLEASATLNTADTGAPTPQWEISLAGASATHVMEWLAGLPHLLHARIETVELSRSHIDGRDRPGQVSGRIVLQWRGKEAP